MGKNEIKKKYAAIFCLLMIITVLFSVTRSPNDTEISDEHIPLGTNAAGELQVSIKDFGAVGDGTTDDTKHIQDAIDYAYNNKIENIIIPEGHYMVSLNSRIRDRYTAISLYSNKKIVMLEGAVIEANPTSMNSYAILNINDCDSVYIEGGTIIGERIGHLGTSGSHGMGINVYNSSNITISNTNIKNCWGDGIYIGGYKNSQITKNILVSNVNISNCRRQGISVTFGKDITIQDSTIWNINGTAPQSGIDIETDWTDTPVEDIRIANNIFYDNVNQDIVLGGRCEDVVIKGNTFAENTLEVHQIAINLVYGDNVIVDNNKVSDREIGICCVKANGTDIFNNDIVGYTKNDIYYGVGVSLCDDAQNINISDNKMSNLTKGLNIGGVSKNVRNISISNNIIENIQTDGFFGYRPVDGLIIKNNIFRHVIERYGLMISNGINVKIADNIIEDCGTEYIIISIGNSFDISKNKFVDNNRTAAENYITITAGAQNCSIFNNTFISDNSNKRIVNASWTTEYPVTIENNISSYTSIPFNVVKTHILKNNIIGMGETTGDIKN